MIRGGVAIADDFAVDLGDEIRRADRQRLRPARAHLLRGRGNLLERRQPALDVMGVDPRDRLHIRLGRIAHDKAGGSFDVLRLHDFAPFALVALGGAASQLLPPNRSVARISRSRMPGSDQAWPAPSTRWNSASGHALCSA